MPFSSILQLLELFKMPVLLLLPHRTKQRFQVQHAMSLNSLFSSYIFGSFLYSANTQIIGIKVKSYLNHQAIQIIFIY